MSFMQDAMGKMSVGSAQSGNVPSNASWPNDDGFKPGDPVEVYSNTLQVWCYGRIERLEGDGMVLTSVTAPNGQTAQKLMHCGNPTLRRATGVPPQQQPFPPEPPTPTQTFSKPVIPELPVEGLMKSVQNMTQSLLGSIATKKPIIGHGIVVDAEEDIVWPNTGRKTTGSLSMEAVHGAGSQATLATKQHGKETCNLSAKFLPNPSASPIANQVVAAATQMAKQVSEEPNDTFDAQWTGPQNQDPLLVLFNASNLQQVAASLERLAAEAQQIFASQPSLVEANIPTKVYGDIHGQFRDVLLFLFHFGFPAYSTKTEFIFNGDFVDRGAHQLEVVALVLALKTVFPTKVWLVRGNHEDCKQNTAAGPLGFGVQCNQRLGENGPRVFGAVNQAWNWLPYGCLIGRKLLVVHGGIGDGRWDTSYLAQVRRPIDHEGLPKDPVLYNVLWSDPIADDPGDPREIMGVHDSPRDNHGRLITSFGPDVTDAFCSRNNLCAVIRSHQAFPRGFGYDVLHNGRCLRVFSARDYGNSGNDGAILSITQGKGTLIIRAQVCRSLGYPKD